MRGEHQCYTSQSFSNANEEHGTLWSSMKPSSLSPRLLQVGNEHL